MIARCNSAAGSTWSAAPDGVTDDTDHHLYDRLRRCQDRASRDATSGMHGGDGGSPEEPTTLGPPRGAGGRRSSHDGHRAFWQGDYASAIWLQLGSALALFGPLDGAQRMLERGSPSESPGTSL